MSGPDQWSRQVPVNFVKMCNGSWRGGDWQQTPELRFEVSHFLRCTFIDSWIARRLIVIWQRQSCWQGWQGVMGPANVITLLPNWHNTSTSSMSLSTSIFSESASVVSKSDTILFKKKFDNHKSCAASYCVPNSQRKHFWPLETSAKCLTPWRVDTQVVPKQISRW